MQNTSCRKICPLPHPGTPSGGPWKWEVCKRMWLEQRGQDDEEYMFMLQECRRTELPLTRGGGRRRWDEIPTHILFKIFLGVPLYFLLHNIAYVCRSWRSSVLDVLFPSTGVLSLQTLDTLPVYICDIYLHLLKVLLNTRPQFQWHTFISPCEFLLPYTAVTYIAQRSPWMENVFLGSRFVENYWLALPYWKNLKNVAYQFFCGEIENISCNLGFYYKKLKVLTLIGRLIPHSAYLVVKNLPGLEYLSLEMSTLTMDTLLIFDGHKNVKTLVLRHSHWCFHKNVDQKPSALLHPKNRRPKTWKKGISEKASGNKRYLRPKNTRLMTWNKDIREKVSGNKRYLRCEEIKCPICSWAYEKVPK